MPFWRTEAVGSIRDVGRALATSSARLGSTQNEFWTQLMNAPSHSDGQIPLLPVSPPLHFSSWVRVVLVRFPSHIFRVRMA
jgi:hypothetical protein